jgi:hypothetical protein
VASDLIQTSEDKRRQFQAMLHDVEAETDRFGCLTLDSVLAEMDQIIRKSVASKTR